MINIYKGKRKVTVGFVFLQLTTKRLMGHLLNTTSVSIISWGVFLTSSSPMPHQFLFSFHPSSQFFPLFLIASHFESLLLFLPCPTPMPYLFLFLFSSHPSSQSFIPLSFISSHFKFKMYLLSLPFPSPMTHLLLFSFHPSLNFYRQPRSSPKTFDCFSPCFPLSLLFMFLFSFNLTFYVTFLFFSYPVITLHAFLLLQFSSP